MIVVVLKGGSDMTKIVSITMAIIIMLTTGITAPQTYTAAPQTITASVKAKPSSHTNKKKKKHKHTMPKGNCHNL